jgi:hypothetical protein
VRRFDCELKEVFEAAIPHVSHDRRVMIENTPSLQSDADSRVQEIFQKLPLSGSEPLTSALPHLQFSTLRLSTLSNRVHHLRNA